MNSSASGQERTIGERLLSPIADVHRGEVVSAVLMTLILFQILASGHPSANPRAGPWLVIVTLLNRQLSDKSAAA